MTSELSGNVIDVSPVDALTSKPYAFTVKPWELKSIERIDVLDVIGSNIRINSRGPEDINEEWIGDKARFSYNGLKRQQLSEPMIRRPDGQLQAVSWKDALEVIAEAAYKMKPEEMAGVAGKLADAESMLALKDFLNRMGCKRLWAERDGKSMDADLRLRFLLNTGIAALEQADVCLLIGTQLRWKARMVNKRLRKAVRFNKTKVAVVGPEVDLTYPHQHMGASTDTLLEIAEGRHPLCAELASAERPVVIVGSGALVRLDKAAIMSALHIIAQQSSLIRDDWFGANVLLLNASQAAARDLGFVPSARARKSMAKFLYRLGADDLTPAIVRRTLSWCTKGITATAARTGPT